MQTIVYMVGPPGSGKSTLSNKLRSEDNQFMVINRDSIRTMLVGNNYDTSTEDIIKRTRNYLIESILSSGYNVVIDDSNLLDHNYASYKEIADRVGDVELIEHFIDIEYEKCWKQNSSRVNSVPKPDFDKMWAQYKKYVKKEYYLSSSREWKIKTFNTDFKRTTLPKAIIVDIDNTIAMHTHGRNPYDHSQIHTDIPNLPLLHILNNLHYYSILLVTGRSEISRDETDRWLNKLNIKYDALFMRPLDKEHEQDRVVKKEIYDKYIKDYFFVYAVFEDRERNVDMWRSINLPTYHVEYGRF